MTVQYWTVVPVTRDAVWVIGVGSMMAEVIGVGILVTENAISEKVFGGLVVKNGIQTTNVDNLVTENCFNGGHRRSSHQTSSTNNPSG